MVFRRGGEWLLGLMLFGFPCVGLGEFVAYDISWVLLLGQIAGGNCCYAPCFQAVSMQAWSSGSLWLGCVLEFHGVCFRFSGGRMKDYLVGDKPL